MLVAKGLQPVLQQICPLAFVADQEELLLRSKVLQRPRHRGQIHIGRPLDGRLQGSVYNAVVLCQALGKLRWGKGLKGPAELVLQNV